MISSANRRTDAAQSSIALICGLIIESFFGAGFLSIVLFKWLLKTNKMIVFIAYTALAGLAVVVVSLIEMNVGYNIFA